MNGPRARKKELTRRALIDSALRQLSSERSFSQLSLREVSREAGLAAPSFYRHFEDMEELGLTLVDEAGVTLRQLMRQARKRIATGGGAIRMSVETFMEYVAGNENIFRLLLRERSGTSAEFRAAVSRELKHFAEELAHYLANVYRCKPAFAQLQADAMVALVFAAGAEALELSNAERRYLTIKTIRQLRLLDSGARATLADKRRTTQPSA